VPTTDNARGRQCPLHYRYSPVVFRCEPSLETDTLYVVGGLYGNVEALHALLEIKRDEEKRGRQVNLVFNGDFHWFDIETGDFREIAEAVLEHFAIRGNVETELEGGADCGCNYPVYVNQDTVEQSNAIMHRLQKIARNYPELLRRHVTLPMHLTAQVGTARIAILHGDPESLAGWQFAVENMEPLDQKLRGGLGCGTGDEITKVSRVSKYFEEAGVSAFACTHTCLPFAQDFAVNGNRRLVINNGAAGMPNFSGRCEGLVTRISACVEIPANSLYGIALDGLRFDAIPVRYDQSAWMARFCACWPPGSPAHVSYFRRLTEGPNFEPHQAARGSVRLT
jgi:hypothetical protein